ncbi:MAG: hypothetical protein LBV61_07655 [Burkholderiaceae bacterium]|jgi:hypothetical protein|nr:hypothetical protein [Burkholderiaceae bacterium]
MRVPPFVAFHATVAFASRLSARLEDMALRESPALRYYWTVRGMFNDGEMFFVLTLGEIPHGLWPAVRRRFDADFARLRGAMEQEVAHVAGSQQTRLEAIGDTEHKDDQQNHANQLTTITRSLCTKRVGGTATDTRCGRGAEQFSAIDALKHGHWSCLLGWGGFLT